MTLSQDITYLGTANLRPQDDDIALPADTPIEPNMPTCDCEEKRADFIERSNALNRLLQTIPNAIATYRQAMSDEIADIVLLMMSQLFIDQQQSKDAIKQKISQVLHQINEKQDLEISLSAYDMNLIQQGEVKLDLAECKHIRFKIDEKLKLGGCIITSKQGLFDASIERQIDNLKQVLLQLRGSA